MRRIRIKLNESAFAKPIVSYKLGLKATSVKGENNALSKTCYMIFQNPKRGIQLMKIQNFSMSLFFKKRLKLTLVISTRDLVVKVVKVYMQTIPLFLYLAVSF